MKPVAEPRIVKRTTQDIQGNILPIPIPDAEREETRIVKRSQMKDLVPSAIPVAMAVKEPSRIAKKFYDTRTGYKGLNAMRVELKDESYKQVKAFYEKQEVVQINAPSISRKRDPMIPIRQPLDTYVLDLLFFPAYKKQNDGYDTFLSAMESTLRTGYIIPIRDKTALTTLAAFKQLQMRVPRPIVKVQSDKGSEFSNTLFREYLGSQFIEQQISETADHRSQGRIEAFNKQIKRLITNYCIANNTARFFDVLSDIEYNYNHTTHASTKRRPGETTDEHYKEIIKLEDERFKKSIAYLEQIQPGMFVRVKIEKNPFAKQGNNWSRMVYTVEGREGFKFKLRDPSGSLVEARFAFYELLPVKAVEYLEPPSVDAIEQAREEARAEAAFRREGIEELPPSQVPEKPLIEARKEKKTKVSRELAKLTIAGTEKLSEVNTQRWYKDFETTKETYKAPERRVNLRSSRK